MNLLSQYTSESVLTYCQNTTLIIFQKRKMKEIDETDYDCINGVGKICLHCLNYKNECNCPR